METMKKRYVELYPELRIDEEWARQNCVIGYSPDDADVSYYITLGAALWMLDALKSCGCLQNALPYLEFDGNELNSLELPKFVEPCYDETLIRSMVYLIKKRDAGMHPLRCFINETTAQRRGPCSAQPKEKSGRSESGSPDTRSQFDAVFQLIDAELKTHAMEKFEEGVWDFLDRYFQCVSFYAKKQGPYEEEMERVIDQCQALFEQMQAKAISWQDPKPAVAAPRLQAPLAPRPVTEAPALSLNNALFPIGAGNRYMGAYDDLDTLRKKALTFHGLAEECHKKRTRLLTTGPTIHMTEPCVLAEHLDPEVNELLLAFSVDDPYESCFAYLCLIEQGSDLPWLFNASLAVLYAAAAKLPWTAGHVGWSVHGEEGKEETGVEEMLEAKETASEDGGLSCQTDTEVTQTHLALYEQKYLDAYLYYPSAPPYEVRVNLPQLVYGLTGVVMPRGESVDAQIAERLLSAGLPEHLVAGVQMYLQLAAAVRIREEQRVQKSISPPDPITELPEPVSQPVSQPEIDIDALLERVRILKTQNETLHKAAYAASKEAERGRDELERRCNEHALERQELVDLRELVFNRENDTEGEARTEAEKEIKLPYRARKKLVIFGGHETWLKAIRPMLPEEVFVTGTIRSNTDLIRNADAIWIQTNALSHNDYYKIVGVARTHHIPVRYFIYSSAEKCALQLASEDMKA